MQTFDNVQVKVEDNFVPLVAPATVHTINLEPIAVVPCSQNGLHLSNDPSCDHCNGPYTRDDQVRRLFHLHNQRTDLLLKRAPLFSKLQNFQKYFRTVIPDNEMGRSHTYGNTVLRITDSPIVSYATKAEIMARLKKRGLKQHLLDIIDKCTSLKVVREKDIHFTRTNIIVDESTEFDLSNMDQDYDYQGSFEDALQEYHQLRKQIAPIKLALQTVNFLCKLAKEDLVKELRKANDDYIWTLGDGKLEFKDKVYALTSSQVSEYFRKHRLHPKIIDAYNQCRLTRKAGRSFNVLNVWINGNIDEEHYFNGIP